MSKLKNKSATKKQSPKPVLVWLGIGNARTLRLFLALAVFLISGLMVVRINHENRTTFIELQELRDQAAQLEVQRGQLLIEQSTFRVDGRIEDKAVQQLNMRVPEADDIIMITQDWKPSD